MCDPDILVIASTFVKLGFVPLLDETLPGLLISVLHFDHCATRLFSALARAAFRLSTQLNRGPFSRENRVLTVKSGFIITSFLIRFGLTKCICESDFVFTNYYLPIIIIHFLDLKIEPDGHSITTVKWFKLYVYNIYIYSYIIYI